MLRWEPSCSLAPRLVNNEYASLVNRIHVMIVTSRVFAASIVSWRIIQCRASSPWRRRWHFSLIYSSLCHDFVSKENGRKSWTLSLITLPLDYIQLELVYLYLKFSVKRTKANFTVISFHRQQAMCACVFIMWKQELLRCNSRFNISLSGWTVFDWLLFSIEARSPCERPAFYTVRLFLCKSVLECFCFVIQRRTITHLGRCRLVFYDKQFLVCGVPLLRNHHSTYVQQPVYFYWIITRTSLTECNTQRFLDMSKQWFYTPMTYHKRNISDAYPRGEEPVSKDIIFMNVVRL